MLRDGVSFVGLVSDDPFLADAPQYVRSIYLDAFLLALLQRAVLDDFANLLATFDERLPDHRAVRQLEQRLVLFRNTLSAPSPKPGPHNASCGRRRTSTGSTNSTTRS